MGTGGPWRTVVDLAATTRPPAGDGIPPGASGVSGWLIGLGIVGGIALIADVLSLLSSGRSGIEWLWRRLRRGPETTDTPAGSAGLDPAALEVWRKALRKSVVARRVAGGESQLGQMLRQSELNKEQRTVPAMLLGRAAEGSQPRVRIRGVTQPLSAIVKKWDANPDRLVVLGEPGYGKTVALLYLLEHVNKVDQPGRPVAELFPLAEWYRWRANHPNDTLEGWLADQLARTHPTTGLTVDIARTLIDAELVIPLLDGLDEIPDDQGAVQGERAACTEAIGDWSGRGVTRRPFVVSCRVDEYNQLAPHWVRSDHEIEVVGLTRDQIVTLLDQHTKGWAAGWAQIRKRVETGDSNVVGLLASPLRFSIALRAYSDQPDELTRIIDGGPDAAESALWDRYLLLGKSTWNGADAAQIREWLALIAAGMRRLGRQRFWLHELPLYNPHQNRDMKQFRVAVGVVGVGVGGIVFGFFGAFWFGLIGFLVGWRVRSLVAGSELGFLLGLILGSVAGAVFGWKARWQPTVSTSFTPPTGWALVRRAWGSMILGGLLAGFLGAVVGLRLGTYIGGQIGRQIGSLAGFLIGVLFGGKIGASLAAEPPRIVVEEPADAPHADDPEWLLAASMRIGLDDLGDGAAGLDAWLYHHWLRFLMDRRARRHRDRGDCLDGLPRDLRGLLDWCAAPERGWLRASDAYEFRHRELLEHLARQASEVGRGELGRL